MDGFTVPAAAAADANVWIADTMNKYILLSPLVAFLIYLCVVTSYRAWDNYFPQREASRNSKRNLCQRRGT